MCKPKNDRIQLVIYLEKEERDEIKKHVMGMNDARIEGEPIIIIGKYLYDCFKFFNDGWQEKVKERDFLIGDLSKENKTLKEFIKKSIPGITMIGDSKI